MGWRICLSELIFAITNSSIERKSTFAISFYIKTVFITCQRLNVEMLIGSELLSLDQQLWYSLNCSFQSFVRRVWDSCDIIFAWVGVYAKIRCSGKMLLSLAIVLCFSLGLLACSVLITDFRADVSYTNCIPQFENITWSHASFIIF